MGQKNRSERNETSAESHTGEFGTDIPGARNLWMSVLANTKKHISTEAVENWLTPLNVVVEYNGAILVSAKDQYTLDRAKQEYGRLLQTLWNEVDPKKRRLKFEHWAQMDRSIRDMAGDPWAGQALPVTVSADPLAPIGLRDDCMRFETLVIGDSNRRAVGLAKRIASGGAVQAGVIVIYGQPGTGKTHLLKSIEKATKANEDARRITYISAEEFMTRFVAGARAGDTEDLQAFVKQNDLLMIDDLHWIAGKEKTDTAFFGALRKVTSEGGRVIITADTAPGDMVGLSKHLTSEMRGAATVEVAQPDHDMRKAIVRRHADLIAETSPNFVLSEAMVDRIVSGIHGPGRELCGVLWSLELETGFGEFAPTDEMLETVIRRIAGEPRTPSLDDIKRACMELYSVSKSDIESSSKVRTICYPRQIGMYLSRTMTDKSFPQIAQAYKKKDHTTCLHAYRKIKKLMANGDADMINDIERARLAVFDRMAAYRTEA